MAQAVKFTFDTCFDEDFGLKPSAAVTRGAAALDEARAEAYAAGFAAGTQEASTRADQDLGSCMQNFASSAASLMVALDAERASLRKYATDLAVAAARKLASTLIAARPEAEIEATLRDCLGHLNREPHIVLRVAESLVGRLREIVDRMALERGLTGRIILLAQDGLVEGDCIVEWADGGLEKARAVMDKEIDAAIGRYLETQSDGQFTNDRIAPNDRIAMSDSGDTSF